MKIEDIYKGSLDGAMNKTTYFFDVKLQEDLPGKLKPTNQKNCTRT
jgi:hypothetical protein